MNGECSPVFVPLVAKHYTGSLDATLVLVRNDLCRQARGCRAIAELINSKTSMGNESC
jgi:hypothetical protein